MVFVTAKDEEDDIVRALEQGADDYIVKPAKQRELVARITAVARRASPCSAGPRDAPAAHEDHGDAKSL